MFHRALLLGTIAAAVAIASCWAIRVPFFQQPDELAHADYVFQLADVGGPFRVTHAVSGHIVTPETRYLARATRYRENRYASSVRMPAAYGSQSYFDALDRAAPATLATPPRAGATMPYVMFAYPMGYYVVAATAMRVAALLHPNSLSREFFAARSIGIICLIATMLLGYEIFTRSRLSRTTATIATFAVGLFPLVSWVSGYIQPDVLTTLLVTAAVYLSLRWKDAPRNATLPVWLAIDLVSLAFVKQHYAIATIAATALTALCVRANQRRPLLLVATFLTPLVAVYAALHLSPVGPLVPPNLSATTAHGASLAQRVGDFATYAFAGLRDAYAGGAAFNDFWFAFGYHAGNHLFPHGWSQNVHDVLVPATLATLTLFILRQRYVLGRLLTIARKRSLGTALRLFAGDPITNVYVFVTAILIFVYAFSNGFVWLEGRYWLPVIVPTLAIVIVRNARLFKSRLRRRVSFGFASAWAAYALVCAPLGLEAIQRCFYTPARTIVASEPFSGILTATAAPTCAPKHDDAELIVHAGCSVRVTGFAIDSSRGLPASDVVVTIDGVRVARARVDRPTPHIVDAYNDEALARSGFAATLQTTHLHSGRHAIGIAIVETSVPYDRFGPDTVALTVLR